MKANIVPLILLVSLLAAPGASATEFSLHGDAPSHCATFDSQSTYRLQVGDHTSSGGAVAIPDQGTAYFVAPAIQSTTQYTVETWIVSLPDATTGRSGFKLSIGVLDAACTTFTSVATASVLATGAGKVSLVPTTAFKVAAGESLSIRVQDLKEVALPVGPSPPPTGTSIDLDATNQLGGSYVISPALSQGYPVPGPASILVMAAGALAVALWVGQRRLGA